MTVAMYLRLSSEDIDLKSGDKTESESISNQRGLLKEFLRGRPEFTGAEILEFCDDGWSGKNFERPAFVQMMEQVKTGKIHCIVVKDLSRFGRDYLVVGNYISRVFPFLGVRFIAVNDGFDSTRQADIDSLDTSFKTLIYDLYSRELSQKVKSAKRQRAAKGLFRAIRLQEGPTGQESSATGPGCGSGCAAHLPPCGRKTRAQRDRGASERRWYSVSHAVQAGKQLLS